MRYLRLFTVTSLLITSLIISSCSKSSNGTYQIFLIGTWMNVQIAEDNNKNGKIDHDEIQPVTPSAESMLIFKSDSTCLALRENWSGGWDTTVAKYIVNGRQLTFIFSGASVSSDIDTLSSARLVMHQTAGPPIIWTMYQRQ